MWFPLNAGISSKRKIRCVIKMLDLVARSVFLRRGGGGTAFWLFQQVVPRGAPPAITGPNWFLGSRAVTPLRLMTSSSQSHSWTAVRSDSEDSCWSREHGNSSSSSLHPDHQLEEIFTCAPPGRTQRDFH